MEKGGARFRDKIAVITGASSGIGAACARAFARQGAAVVLCARSAGPLEQVAATIRAQGGRALAVPADLGQPSSAPAQALLARAAQEFGGIDILVNNAGANTRGPIERYSADELAAVVQINLTAPIVLTRLALPYLRARGGGAIVSVASLAGRVPVNHEAVYSATKFGLRAFTFALADELRDSGIRVSAVSPGPVDTGFIMDRIDQVPDLIFAQPMSTAEQIADLILACAADGKVERMTPIVSGHLATLGYLFPGLRRLLVPVMERKGRKNRERYRGRS